MATDDAIDITWYGQAMFTVSGGGVAVAIDPVPPDVGYPYDPVDADILLITHGHFDHNYVDGVKGSPRLISGSGAFAIDGLEVTGYESFHDESRGAARGPVVIYAWEQAGFKLAHFGDLGDRPAADVMKSLEGLDVAMIPVGGIFTIDGEQAARLVRDLSPAIVLPMHFGTPDCTIDLEPVESFTRRFDGTVRQIAERPVSITRESLPSSTEVWVLPYR